jgi:hypothetical protein
VSPPSPSGGPSSRPASSARDGVPDDQDPAALMFVMNASIKDFVETIA